MKSDWWLAGIGLAVLAAWVLVQRAKTRAEWQAKWRAYESQPYD